MDICWNEGEFFITVFDEQPFSNITGPWNLTWGQTDSPFITLLDLYLQRKKLGLSCSRRKEMFSSRLAQARGPQSLIIRASRLDRFSFQILNVLSRLTRNEPFTQCSCLNLSEPEKSLLWKDWTSERSPERVPFSLYSPIYFLSWNPNTEVWWRGASGCHHPQSESGDRRKRSSFD